MAQETITMPTGFAVVVRGMKAKEMSLLADEQLMKKAKKGRSPIDPLLTNCTLEVIDAGPYAGVAVGPGVTVPWSSILLCDRFHALLRVRACTWGDGYEFKVRCPNATCSHHEKPFIWEVPLSGLEVKPLPEAMVALVRQGQNWYPLQLGGKEVHLKILTGADELRSQRIAGQFDSSEALLAQVASRVLAIEGVKLPKDDREQENNLKKIIAWVGELEIDELRTAQDVINERDGGIETTTKVACPKCEEEFVIEIPFALQGFLLPDRKKKAEPASTASTTPD